MNSQQPVIIIKRKKIVAGGGHHGGAWKVAYADFVTAMMAFFLLMWLLNATTEEQRKGLADYFNPSIPMSRISGGGSGALNGSSLMTEDALISDGAGASAKFTAPGNAPHEGETQGVQSLETVATEIEQARAELQRPDLSEHIQTRMTPDGLLVELVDRQGTPLFPLGSAQASALLEELVAVIAPVLAEAHNPIQIIGHTDALQYGDDARYSNWELSADRANAARRLLVAAGLPDDKIRGVIGRADSDPLSDQAYAVQNRRIAVLLMVAPTR